MLRRFLFLTTTVLTLVTPLAAKGPTVRLEISGNSLTNLITITDESVLSRSNVFGGEFLAGIATEKAINQNWPKYLVSFYVELPAWMKQGVRRKYVVYYAKDPQTGQGFVYLPGAGEEWYHLNVSTILRNGLEGNWLRASAPWATALNAYLP